MRLGERLGERLGLQVPAWPVKFKLRFAEQSYGHRAQMHVSRLTGNPDHNGEYLLDLP